MDMALQNVAQMVCLVLEEWSSNGTNKMPYFIHRVNSRTEKGGNKIDQFDAVGAGLRSPHSTCLTCPILAKKKSLLKININCSERVSLVSQSVNKILIQKTLTSIIFFVKGGGGDEKRDRPI